MKALYTLAFVLFALVVCLPKASAYEPYAGVRKGYAYNHAKGEYVKLHNYEQIIIAQPYPSTLIVNVSPQSSPPTATVSAHAYAEEQARTQKLLAEQAKRQFAESDLAKEFAALRAEVQKLRGGRASAPLNLPPPIPGAARPQAPARPHRDLNVPTPKQHVGLAQVVGILRQHCADCHTGVKARGGVAIFNQAGEYELKGSTPKGLYTSAARDDDPEKDLWRMPKKRPGLDNTELELLRLWSE